MDGQTDAAQIAVAAGRYKKERDYWQKKLSGQLQKSSFPYDYKRIIHQGCNMETSSFQLTPALVSRLIQTSKNFDPRIHMMLVTGLLALINKYTGNTDIVVGAPIYRQEREGRFTNTVLPLRNQVRATMTFKELLLEVKDTIVEAVDHQRYPMERLLDKLDLPDPGLDGDFPLFDTAILLENIHDRTFISHITLNLIFTFVRKYEAIEGLVEFNSLVYKKITVEKIISHFSQLMENALNNVNVRLHEIEILTEEERRQLILDFNDTTRRYGLQRCIHKCFKEQVVKAPANIAVSGVEGASAMTYEELNQRSNQLAQMLRRQGVRAESVVGVMIEPSIERIIVLMAILKAGAAYLPIDSQVPPERVLYMLGDSGARALVTDGTIGKDIAFTALQGFETARDVSIEMTAPRPPIEEFDRMLMPDRSLVDLRNYRNKIGMASVTNCMSLQATRGCPYECLYCHKVWSKKHVHRSAENIYNEIEYYYKKGVINFAFIDDSFNLDKNNSMRLFELLIKNRLNVQLFFPNGVRGDIMTPEYIDAMVAAGTRGINLSLETASPRLQKLIKKNLDINKFKAVIDYIAEKHPDIILEMATMHGFPSETEEEAMMTLNFIKSVKWLHFPYIHILKIYPNTEMEQFALDQGISKKDIIISKDRAFHELPETLPFPKSFSRKYQSNFLNEYFLDKERLKQVLPVQMNILSEAALAQKYNAYLPTEIKSIQDVIDFAGLEDLDINLGFSQEQGARDYPGTSIFDLKPPVRKPNPNAQKILFLDLSQHFSSHQMLYSVTEQPLGEIYLLTYLNQHFGDKIHGRIYKSGNDFDSFEELRTLLEEYQPDLIGIRTLTFFKEFFHETVALIREWEVEVPIITGGPYASSDYDTILKDMNISLAVLGEGEHTLRELIAVMLENDFKLPEPEVLQGIKGIAYVKKSGVGIFRQNHLRTVIHMEQTRKQMDREDCQNLGKLDETGHLAYVMYTSGSTGKPKGVMVEHRQVNNCINWMQEKFQLTSRDVILQRTNLTFDPSVWEIFWPLERGGSTRVISSHQGKDAEFLIRLISGDSDLTMMYCPATLVNAMVSLLEANQEKPILKLPWLIIGAEPISMEVVKTLYSYYEGQVVNTYGPTECTINNTYCDLNPLDKREIVPIGKPVDNNRIYILSPGLQLMPVNIPGEIYIAGDSVARGYANNPEKTKENFIADPFVPGILYKSGDMGRWWEDGNIEIMGRRDEQVKIRGYRIETGEINTALSRHPAVKDCTVVLKNSPKSQRPRESNACKICGINSAYPGITIHDDQCNICQNMENYKGGIEAYFKTLDHLEQAIRKVNKEKKAAYDCLLLYAGGRGAAYALYRLTDMGFRVLAVTYDNGYFSKKDLENIKRVTQSLGVEHLVLTHPNSDVILKESLKTAHTVCRGCFHTSSSLALEYAYNHDIKVVVGATLSRGQIIENKLFMFLQQGIIREEQLEEEIARLQHQVKEMDKNMFDYIDIEVVTNGVAAQKVEILDFYRYCDITNLGMIDYLNQRDPYWKTRKNDAIYSTNCPIKQMGDYGHLKARDFHFYGGATSWEKRLNHLTLENVKEDLNCRITEREFARFSQRIGYRREKKLDRDEKYLCSYYVSDETLTISELRKFLSGKLPGYMIPSHFVRLEKIPLLSNGKIDKQALPEPDRFRSNLSATYVAPGSDMEKLIADIWKEVLEIDMAGVHDNFFDLGGTSLHIIQVSSKLRDVVGKDIPMVTMFTYPTIHSLADFLEGGEGEENLAKKKENRVQKLDKAKNKLMRTINRARGSRV